MSTTVSVEGGGAGAGGEGDGGGGVGGGGEGDGGEGDGEGGGGDGGKGGAYISSSSTQVPLLCKVMRSPSASTGTLKW